MPCSAARLNHSAASASFFSKSHSRGGVLLDLKTYEADMRHLIDTYIEADEPRKISPFDEMPLLDLIVKTGIGNAIASVGPTEAPAILMLGHIDQIGLIVTHIEDDGMLRVRGLGGWDPRVLVGQPVSVRTRSGDVPGVIGSVPIHLQKGDERPSGTEMKALWIDIGAKDGAPEGSASAVM